jgi:hypothetical protein
VTVPRRWDWDAGAGPEHLVAELAATGLAWIHAPGLVEAAERDPWAAAARILGERPELVERQPIRALPGGRSFSSGTMAAPFHSDSQMCLGVPAQVQLMACRRPAASGGESLYLDTWLLLERIEREAPDLFAHLFETSRCIPFVFGEVFGPTVSLRGGSLVFTHSAIPEEGDAVARDLRSFVESAPPIEVRAEAGDVVAIHNHRLLHGRRAFSDPAREFLRLLVWRPGPFPAPDAWHARASRAAAGGEPSDPAARHRLSVVLELLRGVPAGVLSKREAVPEPQLYRWRDEALASALVALGKPRSD